MRTVIKALTAGDKWKKTVAAVALLLLLLTNVALLAVTRRSQEDGIPCILYGSNTVSIGLLLCTIALPGLFTEKNPYSALTTPMFFSVVGTFAGIVVLFSVVVSLGDDNTINGPLALITCIAAVATYVYFIYRRDYS